ncbi:MAG: nucleotide exchange factor GrpE [Clostridia bacterium]
MKDSKKEEKAKTQQSKPQQEAPKGTADNSAQGEVLEDEKQDLGIDRDSMSTEDYIGAIEEKLGLSLAETDMCRNLTKRLQADFDNFRKRNAGVAEEMKKLGEACVIEKMLTVLDNCDLARKYIADPAALTGFNMMETQILSALDSFGLKEIEADGKQFDANFMSAVESEVAPNKSNQVLGVLSKGYMLNNKMLRPASVKVGK